MTAPRRMTVQKSQNPAQEKFEVQEQERLQQRIRKYDRLADDRGKWASKHAYYGGQLKRLIGGLVVPGARVLEVGCGVGDLLAELRPSRGVGIDVSERMINQAKDRHSDLEFHVCDVERDQLPEGPFDYIVFADVIGHLGDIQRGLEAVKPLLAPGGRIVVTYYNFLWEPALNLAEKVGLKTTWPDQNWLSRTDIGNLLHLAGYEAMRSGTDVLTPVDVPVISASLNQVLAKLPGVSHLALVNYYVARPTPEQKPKQLPTTTVICPCRNEKGNIQDAIDRTPMLGPRTELIFVDGNSNDGTVEEIERAIREYKGPLELRLIHQGDGKGKGDAVRKGFAAAKCDVLMILDADLTVPPEDLPKFYWALVTGKGDFINGVRLVYPMEGEAMRFLNLLGNKFFSLALSWLLEQPVKDSLCGTKVLYKRDYDRIAANRDFFGDFDPFGDFDLLFGAARFNLKITDLPVRYRARTYGETKISRFKHGWELMKMTAFGFQVFRMGKGKS